MNVSDCKLSDDTFPPKVIFAVRIEKCYSVVAYRGSTLIPLTDILKNSFQYKLTTYSQLHGIIEKVEESTVNVQSEIKAVGEELRLLNLDTSDSTRKKIEFLCNQLTAHSFPGQHQGKKYDPYVISDAINLFLRSRNAY